MLSVESVCGGLGVILGWWGGVGPWVVRGGVGRVSFRLNNLVSMYDEVLGFWVEPRSTTRFSRFLVE